MYIHLRTLDTLGLILYSLYLLGLFFCACGMDDWLIRCMFIDNFVCVALLC